MRTLIKIIILSFATMFIFTACSVNTKDVSVDYIPTLEVTMFSDEEVQAITRTLAGECYDDKLEDKQKVVEVILNRVSNEKFGKTVLEVLTAKGQFCGYWKQSRPVSESDILIAEETLDRWYANDCKALSEYLFFCSGPNRENVFRVKY